MSPANIAVADQPIYAGWRTGWNPPDDRKIWEWAADHVTLPSAYAIPGDFSVDGSRHLIAIFDAIQDDMVREVTYQAAIQEGKTLVVEISIPWIIANDPGPIMWTMQTDNDAKEQAKTRFNQLLKLCKPVEALMPAGHNDRATTEIYFGDFWLILNGANLSNLQSKSVRWKFNSEIWMPTWQGLMVHAEGRVSKFEEVGNSKIVNESQAGMQGTEIDRAFLKGDQNVWSVDCGGGKHHPLKFFHQAEDGSRAGVVWNKDALRSDGTWNVARAMETCRYVCPATGVEVPDSNETRAMWNRNGKYIPQRPDASPEIKSFTSNALVSKKLSWLVGKWLEASEMANRGLMQGVIDFKLKRLAETYIEEVRDVVSIKGGFGYKYADYFDGQRWDREQFRAISIDRQKDHFWLEARAVSGSGDSRQLYFSRVHTVEQCRAIQTRLGVEDRLVVMDGQYDPSAVLDDCVRYGWTPIHGDKTEFWSHPAPGGKLEKRNYSPRIPILHKGHRVYKFHFCSNSMKDILFGIITSRDTAFEIPDDVSEEYTKHMKGQVKKEIRPGVWIWDRVHTSSQDHGLDTSNMLMAVMCMMRVISTGTVEE